MTEATTRQPVVLLPGQARRIGAPGGPEILEYANSQLTGGTMTLIESGGTEVGSGPPMHVHHSANEAFFVLSGSYRYHIAGEDYVCPGGSFIYLPMGTVHGFYALEPGTRKLNIYAPSAFEGFWEDLDAIMAVGASPDAITELFERYDTSIVGPIPDLYR